MRYLTNARNLKLLWIVCFIGLTSCDLVTKKIVTDHLKFYVPEQQISSADLTSKSAALFSGIEQIDVLGEKGSFVKFKLVFNDRFAFSLGPSLQSIGLLVSVFALGFLAYARFKNPGLGNRWIWLLIFAGAAGNFIDKLFVKSFVTREWMFSLTPQAGHARGVVDFIECAWFGFDRLANIPLLSLLAPHTFPIFNVADSCVTIGIALLLLERWLPKGRLMNASRG